MSLGQKLQGAIERRQGGDTPTQDKNSTKAPEQVLNNFIAEGPNSPYTFDSERDAPLSQLCREGPEKGRRECTIIHMHSTRLFQAMQDRGFFCALPMDPTQTHMECEPRSTETSKD